jgi:hypothetical protein
MSESAISSVDWICIARGPAALHVLTSTLVAEVSFAARAAVTRAAVTRAAVTRAAVTRAAVTRAAVTRAAVTLDAAVTARVHMKSRIGIDQTCDSQAAEAVPPKILHTITPGSGQAHCICFSRTGLSNTAFTASAQPIASP